MRHIDRVTLKESAEPMDYYTCDLDFSKLQVNNKTIDASTLSKIEKKRFKVINRLKRNDLKKKVLEDRFQVASLFKTDPDLKTMRAIFN